MVKGLAIRKEGPLLQLVHGYEAYFFYNSFTLESYRRHHERSFPCHNVIRLHEPRGATA
jgi:hypothetical protein